MSRHPTPSDPLEARARRRVSLKIGWFTHALVYVCVNLGLMLLNSQLPGPRWHMFPLAGWGLGLAIHGLVVALHLAGGGLRERMLLAELTNLRGESRGTFSCAPNGPASPPSRAGKSPIQRWPRPSWRSL